MNNQPELPFDDRPRSTDIPFREFEAWLAAHPRRIVFAIHVKQGFYRLDWKPGEQVANNPPVDTPPQD